MSKEAELTAVARLTGVVLANITYFKTQVMLEPSVVVNIAKATRSGLGSLIRRDPP